MDKLAVPLIVFHIASLKRRKLVQLSMSTQRKQYGLIFKRHYNNDVSCFRDPTSASKAQFRILDILSFISAWLLRHHFKQENFMSRCCINFTLQLRQLKHISDPSVFKATNNAVEIRLNNSDRFLYMHHISDHHLSIYLISSNHLLKHNLSFIYPY